MRLVLSGPASGRVKGQEEFHGLIGIEKAELLPGIPKFCMEPISFREIEMDLGFVVKVYVIMHGLPVLDHRVHLLVVFVLCVLQILADMSIAFWKFNKNFLSEFGGKDKTGKQKKSGNIGVKEFPRPLCSENGGKIRDTF